MSFFLIMLTLAWKWVEHCVCLFTDLVITTTAVIPGSGASLRTKYAGEAITIGQSVFVVTSTDRVWLADCNDTGTPRNSIDGVAVSSATAAGQYVTYQDGGTLAFGAILTAGLIYVSSATQGGIAQSSNLASGWYTNVVGYASTTSNLIVKPYASGCVQ